MGAFMPVVKRFGAGGANQLLRNHEGFAHVGLFLNKVLFYFFTGLQATGFTFSVVVQKFLIHGVYHFNARTVRRRGFF
jgi:hypothetical protein